MAYLENPGISWIDVILASHNIPKEKYGRFKAGNGLQAEE